MLIATGPLAPLGDFLQIICWIVLPVWLLCSLFTVLHHYARKRKNAAQPLALEELAQLTTPADSKEGALLYFDHSGLLREYRQKLSYSHARYSALKKDYEKLESKYNARRQNLSEHPKTNHMEMTPDQKMILTAPPTSEELYLKDLVEEQKVQVSFLQAQLEQRIRRQHEMEAEKERMRKDLELQLTEKEQLIHAKAEQIMIAENQLAELQQQNELLNAAAADSNEKVDILRSELDDGKAKLAAAEEKLSTNKQLLQRLYREFAACVDDEETSPVVVPLQTAYLSPVAADY
jgi:predicted nuclease with TOPRIM domain